MEKSTEENEVFECTDCGADVKEDADICPNCGAKFNNEVKPWSRWFARVFDYQVVGFILVFIIAIIAPDLLSIKFIFLNMLLTFIYVFVEAAFLVIWGTTPGKFLLNIQLVPSKQRKITFDIAFKRSFLVWLQGVGLGFPLATLILSFVWLGKLKSDKITSWDKSTHINVIHNKNSSVKLAIFVLILIGVFILNVYLTVLEKQNQF